MVRKGFVIFLALTAAAGLHALLSSLHPSLVLMVNAFAVAVVFIAIIYGEVEGAVVGTAAGLIQDALSHSVFGIGGLSLTISGFLAGWISRRIDVGTFYRCFVMTLAVSLIQLIIWAFFYALIFGKALLYTGPAVYLQAGFTALLSSIFIKLFKKLNLGV
ncbi:MAG: rod shape-determining protein MreD [Candidatus Saccharicenans sp.]